MLDPRLARLVAADLDPEVRAAILRTPRLPFATRMLLPLARVLYDIGARTKRVRGVQVTRERHGTLQMLIYSPMQRKPSGAAVLWLFGGGHIAGRPAHVNSAASLTAAETGATVFVPQYRLAPRHPFPADLDDAFAAWEWLVEKAQDRGLDPTRIALAGNSAGAGLAACLAQRILDAGGTQPKAQALFYPMLDDRTAIDRSLDARNHFIWNNKANLVAWSVYLAPNAPGAPNLPPYAAAARRGSLAGLPPTWLGICGVDLFADECRSYARELKRDGVRCKVHETPGVPHAFEVLAPEAGISQAFVQSAIAFIERELRS